MNTIKFKTREWKITKNPVFVVGLWPGTQRESHKDRTVFTGNRSGDFITDEILPFVSNVYLTNLSNYYTGGELPKKYLKKGLAELEKDLKKYKPSKVITLGDLVYNNFKNKSWTNLFDVVLLPHPGYILRFNKDKNKYKKLLIEQINNIGLKNEDGK